MADYFLQFALTVPVSSDAAYEWLQVVLPALPDVFSITDESEKRAAKQLKRLVAGKSPEHQSALTELSRRLLRSDFDGPGFQWQLDRETSADGPVGELHLFAEECGDTDQVITLLEVYLSQCDPKRIISLSWAYSCSKMRSGDFGGGAAVVTATGTTYVDTISWAQSLADKLEAEHTL